MTSTPTGAYTHDAFISYSTRASARLGAALEHALTILGRVWDEPRAMDVFRDVSDQPATSELAAELLRHLDGSRYLIVLTSPAAAASPWVEAEVRHWLERFGTRRLLLVIGDGEVSWDRATGRFTPGSALPGALEEVFREEPKWVDMRWTVGVDYDPDGDRFLDDVADLSAAITGVRKEEIIGRHWREYRKALARRLADDAAEGEEVPADLSLLLASAATMLENSPPTRRALSRVLEATADLQVTMVPESPTAPRVTAVAYGQKDDEVLLGFSDGTVAVWDTRSGVEGERTLPAAARPVTTLLPFAAGSGLALGYDDGRVALVRDGQVTREWPANGSPARCLAVSSTGDHLAVAAGGSSLRLLSAAHGGRTVEGFIGIAKLHFQDDDSLLVHGWSTLVRVDPETGASERVGSLPSLPRPGPKAYSRDGTRCVYTQLDGGGVSTCAVPEDDDEEVFFEGPAGMIDLVALDPDGRYVAEVVPGELLIWQVEPYEPAPVRRSRTSVLRGKDLLVGAGGRWVSILGEDRWELHVPGTGSLCAQVAEHVIDVPSVVQAALDVAFSPDSRVLAWISNPSRTFFYDTPPVSILDLITGEPLAGVGDRSARRVCFVDDRTVEVVDLDDRVAVWDVETGHRLPRAPSPARTDHRAVQVDWERSTIIVEEGARELDVLTYGPGAIPRAWCLQPAGPLWALASSGGSITLRDAEAAAALWTVPGIRAAVLEMDARGRLLAALTSRGRLVLLDVPTGQVVARLTVHAGPRYAVASSPDGARLAVVSPGGPLTVVDTDVASWLARAGERAGRSLTPAERRAFGLERLRVDAPRLRGQAP